jgi:predicted DNA binding protein
MDEIKGDVVGIDVRLNEESCNVDVVVRDPSDDTVVTKYFENQLCEHCPGKIFSGRGCLPRYIELQRGSFVVETYVSDTAAVAELVGGIREICKRVQVKSIVSTETDDFQEDCSVDVTALTEKQREAVAHAQELGYYDPDSAVSLEELADRVGISTSAISQRLKRAENNVLRQIPADCSCQDDTA